jgi:hypothetical protein
MFAKNVQSAVTQPAVLLIWGKKKAPFGFEEFALSDIYNVQECRVPFQLDFPAKQVFDV